MAPASSSSSSSTAGVLLDGEESLISLAPDVVTVLENAKKKARDGQKKAAAANGLVRSAVEAGAPGQPRRRQERPELLVEAIVGYQGDWMPDPPPIRLVRRGKVLQPGEVFETQSDEISKEYGNSPVAKASRARFNWVARTDGARFTRDPDKMVPAARSKGMIGKWTCDICGAECSEQLFMFRAFLRKELAPVGPRTLDPFVAYISSTCGKGLLGVLSDVTRFREDVFSLASKDASMDEVREQLEDAMRRGDRDSRQSLLEELERLAEVGPGGARRTLEMSAVERLIPGKDPAVLLRMPEDTFRAVARSLAPRVSSRLLAAACVMQARVEGAQLARGGYLESVAASVTNGGPLPQAPVRWPLEEVLQSMDLLARAANADPEQPLLRLELACSWEESGLRSFGPAGAAAVVRLGYLQARQALHAFAGGRVAKEVAAALQERLEPAARLDACAAQAHASSAGATCPGGRVPSARRIGRATALGRGWHAADWAEQLRNLLGVRFDFARRPLQLVTGCSGAEAPHWALLDLIGENSFTQLWGSEINENPRRFMLRNVKTQHIFEDICYVMAGGGRCAKHAGYCATPTGPVDIFIGGFPCTPYSFANPQRFKRNCFTDPAAKPFFEMRKFIADRRPRLVILENVRGLLAPNPETDASPIEFILRGKNPDKKEHCYEGTEPGADWGLQFIEGYGLRWDVFYSCDWGLPQSRPRVYIVMVRDDAGGQEAAERMFDILKACMGRLPQGAFSDFLFEEDDPRLLAARQDWAAKAAKRDGLGRVPLTKFSEALFRTMREQLGLKASDRPYSGSMPEGWLPHCTEKQVQSLDVVWAQAERQGADLNFLLADLSQQVSRGCWRDDGNIPTLTTGCMLYSYARERLLLGEECLLLNGFPIDHLDLQNHSQAEMIFLAGNTMSIPLVGAVLFAGLVALDWGPDRSVTVGCHELPAPVSIRADARKLAEASSSSLVMRCSQALLDDDNEGAVDLAVEAVREGEAAAQDPEQQQPWARRASVLLAIARDFALAEGKRKDKGLGKRKDKGTSTFLTLIAEHDPDVGKAAPQAESDDDAAMGDGTGWEERMAKVEAKKAEAPELLRWLREGISLLHAMDREEGISRAEGLRKFVEKGLLQLKVDQKAERLRRLGTPEVLHYLWKDLLIREAKPFFCRVQLDSLKQDLRQPKAGSDAEWLDRAAQLANADMTSQRMELLEAVRQVQPPPAPRLCRLLRMWKADCTMMDKEIKLVLETLKSLLSAWERPKARHQVWCGLDGATEVGRLARELARACQTNKKPASGNALSRLAEEAEKMAEEEAGPAAKQPRAAAQEPGAALAFMEKKVAAEERLAACIGSESMKLSEWSVKMGALMKELTGLLAPLGLDPQGGLLLLDEVGRLDLARRGCELIREGIDRHAVKQGEDLVLQLVERELRIAGLEKVLEIPGNASLLSRVDGHPEEDRARLLAGLQAAGASEEHASMTVEAALRAHVMVSRLYPEGIQMPEGWQVGVSSTGLQFFYQQGDPKKETQWRIPLYPDDKLDEALGPEGRPDLQKQAGAPAAAATAAEPPAAADEAAPADPKKAPSVASRLPPRPAVPLGGRGSGPAASQAAKGDPLPKALEETSVAEMPAGSLLDALGPRAPTTPPKKKKRPQEQPALAPASSFRAAGGLPGAGQQWPKAFVFGPPGLSQPSLAPAAVAKSGSRHFFLSLARMRNQPRPPVLAPAAPARVLAVDAAAPPAPPRAPTSPKARRGEGPPRAPSEDGAPAPASPKGPEEPPQGQPRQAEGADPMGDFYATRQVGQAAGGAGPAPASTAQPKPVQLPTPQPKPAPGKEPGARATPQPPKLPPPAWLIQKANGPSPAAAAEAPGGPPPPPAQAAATAAGPLGPAGQFGGDQGPAGQLAPPPRPAGPQQAQGEKPGWAKRPIMLPNGPLMPVSFVLPHPHSQQLPRQMPQITIPFHSPPYAARPKLPGPQEPARPPPDAILKKNPGPAPKTPPRQPPKAQAAAAQPQAAAAQPPKAQAVLPAPPAPPSGAEVAVPMPVSRPCPRPPAPPARERSRSRSPRK